ncbi:MAG: GNAT family N-acetyltransferase [Actinomycetota bacterium]|nr:GNAT family N-acetyltransferase [Actinomycetota bacterium]
MVTLEIRHLTAADVDDVMAAGHLFDDEPQREWTEAFFARDGHHMLFAWWGDEAVGFVTGIENLHPDKGVEMMLYELGVDAAYRRRGIARSLVAALADLAIERGCYGMWVPIEPDNEPAEATYRSAGAEEPEAGFTMNWTFDD